MSVNTLYDVLRNHGEIALFLAPSQRKTFLYERYAARARLGKAEELADTLLKRVERDDEASSESFLYEIETAGYRGNSRPIFGQLFHISPRFRGTDPVFRFPWEHGKAPIDFLPEWPSRRVPVLWTQFSST